MATLLFEGWDLNVSPYYGETVSGSIHDYNGWPSWTHGSPTQLDFIAGKDQGKAAVVMKNYFTKTSSAGSSPVYRVSFFAKIHETVGSPDDSEMCSVYHTDDERVAVVYSDGQLRLAKGFSSEIDYTPSTLMGTGGATITTSWAHYELYVNATTDVVELYKDGSLADSASGALPSATNLNRFRIRAIGTSNSHLHRIAYDHIVITDGTTSLIGTTGYHGVGVTYSTASKDTGNGLSLRGRINVGGTTYFATAHSPFLRGNTTGYAPRAMNTWSDYWMTNPDTGLDWGTDLSVIESWGICRVDDTGGWAIFPAAALTYVEIVGNYPQVKWFAPSPALSVDDVWVRTNDAVSWNGHIDDYPRVYPPYDFSLAGIDSGVAVSDEGPNPFDDTTWAGFSYTTLFYEDYIGVTGPGCITFGSSESEVIPDVGTVGFTFAEEWRTDYQDWVTVDGTGDDFCSYFISGYKIHGDGNKKFQSNYLTVNFETDTDGSAYIQGVWDYALGNTPNDADARSDTGRWSSTQQVYGPTNSEAYKHAFSKLKIRGHGKSMQLKLKCESGKPFYINGWSMFVTGNSTT